MNTEQIGVLLVEDNPVDAMLLRETLATVPGVDFALTQVVRLSEGQARLRAESYDVVLLDLGLPDSTGPETFTRLQRSNPSVPVLVLTGLSDEEVGLRAMQEGAQDYLLKDQLQAPLLGRSIRYAIERHRAASQLSRSEARLAGIIGSAMDGIVVVDVHGAVLQVNPAAERMFGDRTDSMLGQRIDAYLSTPSSPRGAWQELIRLRPASAGNGINTAIGRRQDGTHFPVEATIAKTDVDGQSLYTLILRDVTERHRADELLRRTKDELQAIVSASPLPIVAVDLHGVVRLWSHAAERLFGWNEGEVLGAPLPILPSAAEESYEELTSTTSDGARSNLLGQRLTRDGRVLEVSISTAALRDQEGRSIGRVAVYVDLTEQLALRGALRASEERFALAFQANPSGNVLIRAADRRIVEVNEAFLKLIGRSRDDVVGQLATAFQIAPTHAGDAAAWDIVSATPSRLNVDCQLTAGDGSQRYASLSAQRLDIDGEAYIMAVLQDVTERITAIESLRESEERFRQVAETIHEVFWLLDTADHHVIYVSPAYEEIWGRDVATLRTTDDWLASIHPDDRGRIREAMRKQLLGTYDEEFRIVRPDGVVRWIRDQAFPVRNAAGEVIRLAGVAEDVTGRRHLEAQLRQTQKMESVGQLAGGVAHDFNNFLTVISGCAELLLMTGADAPDAREILDEIRRTSERAASLTRQLLSFSRQEIVEPRVIDLNSVVIDTDKMLRRLLGEDVEFHSVLSPGLLPVRIDPGQWSQVLMNLAVNARDAMPRGGQLTIETQNVSATPSGHALPGLTGGPFVMLALTDTGVGMTPEVRTRIFEPFFTTKGLGRGTGLGLSVVHGIVTQSAGHIDVYSELGKGTTFRMYLPAAEPREESGGNVTLAAAAGGTETILIAEDELSIRTFASRALRAVGYTVILAANGAEAIHLMEQHEGDVHLLLTDVVMPIVDGRQLSEALLARHPNLRVLYTSGYTDDAVVRHGILRAEVAFLQKPYSLETLRRRVRDVLDRRA
ncbi:MAG: PAS domain S-box protein [Gemmatimonadaceae bacterium]